MKANIKKPKITKDSTPEEVIKYFSKIFKIKEIDLISFIIESISGDVLPYLIDQDYIYLGIKEELKKKIQKYVSDNIFHLTKNELEIDINFNSSETEVEKFFKNNFNLKKQIKNINGKNLFSLTEKKMKNLGLNLGQRKKLNIFLEHKKKNISRNHDNVKENISTIKETEKKEVIINIPLSIRKAIFIKEEKKKIRTTPISNYTIE